MAIIVGGIIGACLANIIIMTVHLIIDTRRLRNLYKARDKLNDTACEIGG
jgi:hypothetical protein